MDDPFHCESPIGEVRGQHSPLAPAFQEVQHAAENVIQVHGAGLVRRRADSNVGRIRANCSRLMSLG